MDKAQREMTDEEKAKVLDCRDRVGRIKIDLGLFARILFTPETQVIRAIPNFDQWKREAIVLDVRHEKLEKVKEGDDVPEVYAYFSNCPAGHIQKIGFMRKKADINARPEEVDIMNVTKQHEKCEAPPLPMKPDA